jgi:tetratricopeptide (TPR) repeat protein
VHLFKVVGARTTESRFDAAHGKVALTPLVGREEEVELLLRRWAQAKRGEGQVVLLCGEPGIGKSRITQVLRERISGEPYTKFRFQCSPFHTHSALYPVIEQFERAAGFAREDTPEHKLGKMEALLREVGEEFKSVAPLFAAMLSLPAHRYPPLALSPQKQKEKTLQALSAQVESLSAKRPVLMILEDAHWVDPTTQEAFDITVSRIAQQRVLLVITYRPEYIPPWVGQPHVTSLTLNRLSRRQGTELVAKVTAGKALPAELLEQILARTDGVPLFVEELTKATLESGLLRKQGDHYTLQVPLPALAIPTTLRESLLARLERLAPIREVAQIGACIGREFSCELLTAVSPLKGVRLEQALEQLTKTGLVFRRSTSPDAVYTFKHALVQDAAYDSLLKSKRTQLHAQIARVLEKHFSDQVANEPELLAHHFTQAGLTKEAIGYWHLAAQRAGQRLAYAEAVAYFQRGIELAGTLPDAPDVAALELGSQIGLGFALIPTKGYTAPESLLAFTRAQALCQQAGEIGPPLLSALRGLFVFNLVRGAPGSAHEFAERCLLLAERAGSSDMLVVAHALRGTSAYRLGHFASARVDFEKSIASNNVARHGEHMLAYGLDPKAGALNWLAPTLWALGYPEQALTCCAEVEAVARQSSHPFTQCFAHQAAAMLHELRREPQATERYADLLIALAADQGFPFFTALGAALRSLSVIQQGKGGSQELAQIQAAIDTMRAAGALDPALRFQTYLAQAHLHLGDIQAALESSQEGLRLTRQRAQGEFEALFLRLLGDVCARSNGADIEAENFYRDSIEVARRQEAKSLELQAALAQASLWSGQGKRKPALELLQPVYDWFTEGRSTRDQLEAAALLAELR